MPSFDVVCEIDMHELANAVDQANREIDTRFDFKGSDARIVRRDDAVELHGENEFQLGQMLDILHKKLVKRAVDIASLDVGEIELRGRRAQQTLGLRQGIDADTARKIIRRIKDEKLKVQTAIQGDQLRVSGKQRDDLQAVIGFLKQADFGLPLQYNNFRD